MLIHNSTLAFNVAGYEGTGKVFIYERIEDTWEYQQEIRIGRYEDNFGSNIDIDGDYMVIGASAPFQSLPDFSNEEEGRAYIYRKSSEGWIQVKEFLSVKSEPDNLFGDCVAIQNNYLRVGSPKKRLLHVYKLDGKWELLRVEKMSVHDISLATIIL